MVCPRCIETVSSIFNHLKIPTEKIVLGEVVVAKILPAQEKILEQALETKGFELLKDPKLKIVNEIKSIIIAQVHHKEDPLSINFSTLISDQLKQDYSSLSRLFSATESLTIERFIVKQKIEKVKELLFYNELTLAEIAFRMDYSSPAHLSTQFKKETGVTPTEFKKTKGPRHQPLDSI